MFDWITGFVEHTGYVGIALLMFIENVFPPIPSELIMPLAGYSAARGDLHLAFVILAGAIGSVAGATVWYYAGRWLGQNRLKRIAGQYGRWLTLKPREIDKSTEWFDRHSGKSVFFGRLVPAVRTLISVPAGIAEMSLGRFLAYSGAGSVVWSGFLSCAGFLLEGQYERASAWLNPASNIIIGLLVVFYLYRVVTFRPAGKSRAER